MRSRLSQRTAIFILIGFFVLIYLINLAIFTLTAKAQLAAGGLFLIALGGLWIYLVGGVEKLICDRETCRIIKPRFLLRARHVETMQISNIEEVRVQDVYLPSHDGPGRTSYQVVLQMRDKGSRSFSLEDSQQRAQAIANRVNAYLITTNHEPLVVRRVPWLMIAVGAGGIGFGVLLTLSAI